MVLLKMTIYWKVLIEKIDKIYPNILHPPILVTPVSPERLIQMR